MGTVVNKLWGSTVAKTVVKIKLGRKCYKMQKLKEDVNYNA